MATPFKLTDEDKKAICHRYQAGERTRDLAKEYRVGISTIYYTLRYNKVERTVNFHNLTVAEIEEIKQLYATGLTSYQVARQFGVSRPAICAHLRHGDKPRIPRGSAQRRYTCNEYFFDQIDTPSKAYWLGMMVTDGWVIDGSKVGISLKLDDKPHVEKFVRRLDSSYPVLTYKVISNGKVFYKAHLCMFSKHMAESLGQYGVIERKSSSVRWVDLLPSLMRHFARGVFDGDGHITISRNSAYMSVVGTESITTGFQSILMQECQLGKTKITPHDKSEGVFSFGYSGDRQCLRIFNWLYEDAEDYLERKYRMAADHLKAKSRYRPLMRFG